MKRSPILCLLAACLLVLASCKNSKSDLFIPKDAALVFHINSSSLSSKLSWDEIKKTNWYKDLYESAQKEDSLAQKIVENPEASGINTKSDLAFFIKKRGNGGFSVFQGGIKDAAAFEALVKKMSRKDKTGKDGDWSFVEVDNRSLVFWNSSKFAVINDMPLGNMNPMGGGRESTHFENDSLKVFVKQVMTLDNDESLFDDDRFASVMKETGDMHLWINSGLLYSDLSGMLSMMKAGTLFEGNASGGTINFDDGKITMKAKQFYNKEMQKALEKMKIKNVDASVLNRIPSDNVIGVMAMNIDPAGLKEFFKMLGFDGMINAYLSKANLTFDELVAATKGDFVLAASDLQIKDTVITFPTEPGQEPFVHRTSAPDVDFLVATSVNQKTSFDKLVNLIPQDEPNMPFTYQLNNEWFVAGNKPASINSFLAGPSKKHAFVEKLSGHPFGMYIDIQKILQTNFSNNAMTKSLLTESAAIWKDVVAVGYDFKDGVATSEITINMMDGKTNSLKQLNQYIEKMNETRKKNTMVYDNGVSQDSSGVMPPPPPPPAVDEAN